MQNPVHFFRTGFVFIYSLSNYHRSKSNNFLCPASSFFRSKIYKAPAPPFASAGFLNPKIKGLISECESQFGTDSRNTPFALNNVSSIPFPVTIRTHLLPELYAALIKSQTCSKAAFSVVHANQEQPLL